MIIRQATWSDAATLSALARETYTAAFAHSMQPSDLAAHLAEHLSQQQVERMLEQDTILVAEEQGRMIGFVQCGSADLSFGFVSEGDQELRRLYVHADYQQQGVGTRLLEAALAQPSVRNAQRIFLDVWEHNPGARRLYERYGFAKIGERAFHVESGAQTSRDFIMVRRAAP